MSASMLVFFLNDICIKQASAFLPLGEMLFVRGVMCLAVLAVAVTIAGEWGHLKYLYDRRIGLRAFAEVFVSVLYILGFISLPVADATAIYQVTPLASTAAAAIFLKEKVGWRRWAAIAVGFVGVLVILRPGTHAFAPAALFTLGSVAFVILRDFVTATLPKEVTTLLIVVSSVMVMTVVGPLLMPLEVHISTQPTWVMPPPVALAYLATSGTLLLVGYVMLIFALRSAEMSAVGPFRYTILIWSFLASLLFYGTMPDGPTWVGALIIVASGIYLVHRERVRQAETKVSGPI